MDYETNKALGHEDTHHLKIKAIVAVNEQLTLFKKDSRYSKGWKEISDNGSTIHLIPDTSTTSWTKFMMVYNPENWELVEPIQFVCIMAFPVGAPCRIAYQTGDKNIQGANFRIMSMDIEEKIKEIARNLKKDFTFDLEIVPNSEELNYEV